MASIQEYLQKILSARYGRDVRQSIHDGMKETYDIATGAQGSATASANTAIAKANEAIMASNNATAKAEEALASAEQAKTYAENAAAVTGIEIAGQNKAGLVKGGDIYIAEDGTMHFIANTTEKILPHSYAGGLKINEVQGTSEQYSGTITDEEGNEVTVPSPDYPQEIKSVVVSEIKTTDDSSNESVITLSEPITLYGIGEVKDRIMRKNGVLGIERNIKQYEFTSIRAMLNSTNTIRHFADVSDYNGGYNLAILCNRLLAKNIYSVDEAGIMLFKTDSGYVFVIRLPKSVLTAETSEAFLEYLKANIEVYYITSYPTFEPLPTADQIALHSLTTFDGVTHIVTDSTLEPVIDVDYGTSKVGAYTLDAWNTAKRNEIKNAQMEVLITELATAMVAESEE